MRNLTIKCSRKCGKILQNFLYRCEGFCKLQVTTNDENTKQFSNRIYLYIYAAGGTPVLGHHSWLSDACASGFSFIYFTFKDNHK